MAKGKQTCKILKEIRKQIAAENDIELITSECTHKGDCAGTCPKCEAEVRYLERELEKRQRMGKAAVFAGLSLGTIVAATGCGPFQPTAGMPMDPNDTTTVVQTDSLPEIEEPLPGDVMMPVPDSLVKDTVPEDVVPLVGEPAEVLEGFVEPTCDESEPEPYILVELMPEFPGGPEKLQEYVTTNIHYPSDAVEKGVEGKVFVGFVVEEDGSIGDVELLRGIGYGCDEEAMRVVRSFPKWNPGEKDGKVVRVRLQMPVFFKLEDKQD